MVIQALEHNDNIKLHEATMNTDNRVLPKYFYLAYSLISRQALVIAILIHVILGLMPSKKRDKVTFYPKIARF